MTRYTADAEIIVSSTDQNAAYPQSVTSLEDGYVVVWYAGNTADTNWLEGDLYAQRYDDFGQKVGEPILVNTTTSDDQYGGHTIALDDGGFVVTWVSATVADELNNLQNGIVTAQRFDAAGNKVGDEVEFGSCDANSPPFIVGLDSGDVVVYWTNYVNGVAQLYAQSLNSDGEPTGGPQVIQQGMVLESIANINGNVIATFADGDIRVSNLGTSGLGNGASPALVNSGYTTGDQLLSHVAEIGGGRYVVVWTSSGQDGDGYGIFQQIYNADGTKYGNMSGVNASTAGNQYYSQVTALANGQYVILYSSPDGSNAGVFAQIFDATGQKVGAEFMVNTTTAGSQTLPAVIGGENGFAVYWSGIDADGFGQLYQRTYHAGLTLTGSPNVDTLTGAEYADELAGLAGNDTLNGLAGDDYLDGGTGADVLKGGTGNDTYYVDNASDVVTELNGQGTDIIFTSVNYSISSYVENLTLTGTSNLNATGNSLGNTLIGNSGNNVLNGGAGADTMKGGAGNDTYYVDSFSDVVTELKNEGTDTVISSVQYIMGGSYVENVTLTGTLNSYATGNALDNILIGNSGNNNLTGGAGNDRLDGGAGADGLRGGVGNDTYYVDNLGDFIVENNGEGTDLVYSAVSFNLGAQYIENLTLQGTDNINGLGNSLANTITGNSGNNTLDGRAGADTMSGGLGNDTYYVDNLGDKVYESKDQGADTVYSSVTFAMGGQYIENLYLTGSGNINGTGTSQANTLVGNAGKNTLTGGAGNDTLTGGGGADIFFFGAGSGKDTITDFSASQNDSLNLHAYSQATAVITQVGNDTVIDLGGGNVITLTGTLKADVTSHIVW